MAEVLDLANLSVLDCPDPEEVDGDRDATFPPSAALANETQDSEARCLAELKRLAVQVGPPVPILLTERDELCDTPKMLWGVGVRLLVTPMELDLGIEGFRKSFAGQFTAHECVPSVKALAHDLDVLLRHHLVRQPGGFEGFVPVLKHPQPHDFLVAELEELEELALNLDTAAFAAPILVNSGQNMLTESVNSSTSIRKSSHVPTHMAVARRTPSCPW